MRDELLLLSLCRAALGEAVEDREPLAALDEKGWTSLYRLAKHHDLAHLAARGVSQLSLSPPEEILSKLNKQAMIALYRTEQVSFELASLTEALNRAGIAHLPLKGSVLRAYYPSPELRLSCDIDLLVSKDDLARARELLTSSLGYTDKGEQSHDVQLYAPSGLHVELHFDLIESDALAEAAALLGDVWRYASPSEKGSYTYRLLDEMFYFYHIAHMAKHFTVTGGCGVRPFLDLHVLHRAGRCGDEGARKHLLSIGGLATFEEAALELARVWMEDGAPTPRAEAMASFVLTGGVYGVVENRVSLAYGRGKGRFAYVLSRLFPPFSFMCARYPLLKRLPILLPLCYLLRLFSPLWSGRARLLAREARASRSISREESLGARALLSELGLLDQPKASSEN
jgi:hypothetical protein